jgi:hypothetical protein
MFGGTMSYMAPEHLDAFDKGDAKAQSVDQRSDMYSLGIVLFEFATGKRPSSKAETADVLAMGHSSLATVIRRCLQPEPAQRYQSAHELAEALQGCRELRRIEKELPAAGPLTRAALRHPLAALILLTLLPHVLGSIVNISYNSLRIVSALTLDQQVAFTRLVLGYNLVVYPLCVVCLYWLVRPLWQTNHPLSGGEPSTEDLNARLRKRALSLPFWAVVLSCVGWLPGGLLFPLALHGLAGPLPPNVFGHFLFSFTISGLIALTYSVYGVAFVVLRVLYPRLWGDARGLRQTMAIELATMGGRLRILQIWPARSRSRLPS